MICCSVVSFALLAQLIGREVYSNVCFIRLCQLYQLHAGGIISGFGLGVKACAKMVFTSFNLGHISQICNHSTAYKYIPPFHTVFRYMLLAERLRDTREKQQVIRWL